MANINVVCPDCKKELDSKKLNDNTKRLLSSLEFISVEEVLNGTEKENSNGNFRCYECGGDFKLRRDGSAVGWKGRYIPEDAVR